MDASLAIRRLSKAAWVVALAVFVSFPALAQTYSRLVVFGDSWTADCCSNGPPWPEVLADELDIPLRNLARGGATSSDLLVQARNYVNGGADIGALHIYWNLGNDFGLPGALQDISGTVAKIGANMGAALGLLQQAGVEQILVLNAPDLGSAPGAAANGATPQMTRQMWMQQNAAIGDVLDALGLADALVDAFTIFNEIIGDPRFSNVTSSCMAVGCPNPNAYVWWDAGHPTAEVHRMLAAGIHEEIRARLSKPNPPTNLRAE